MIYALLYTVIAFLAISFLPVWLMIIVVSLALLILAPLAVS